MDRVPQGGDTAEALARDEAEVGVVVVHVANEDLDRVANHAPVRARVIGSVYGALVGGLALGVAMELSTWPSLLGGVNPVYKPVVAFAVLIAALMVRPQGLFGRARVV